MPRTGPLGKFDLPANTDNQQPNTPIRSAMFNAFADDIEQTFNTPTPESYGGTGAATFAGARSNILGVSNSTDDALVRFDGTSGKMQDSTVTLSDGGNMAGLSYLNIKAQSAGGGLLVENINNDSATTARILNSTGTGLSIQAIGSTYSGGTTFGVGQNGVSVAANGKIAYGTTSAEDAEFWTNNTYRGKFVGSNGFFLVGARTSPLATVEVGTIIGPEGTITTKRAGTAGSTHLTFANNATSSPNTVGSVTTSGSTTSFNTSSDGRLKPLREDFDSGSLIDALEPIRHNWKDYPTQWSYGLVAQDAHQVVPTAVSIGSGNVGDDNFIPWSMDYSKIVPILIKEIQNLRKRLSDGGL